jgi:hypothetical protein
MNEAFAMWMLMLVFPGSNYAVYNFHDEPSCEIVRKQVVEKIKNVEAACMFVPALDAQIAGRQRQADHDHPHPDQH